METVTTPAVGDGIAAVRRVGFVEMLEAVEMDVGGFLALEEHHAAGYAPPPPHAVGLCLPSDSGRMLCFGGDGKMTGGVETTSSTSSSSSNSGLSKHKTLEIKEGRTSGAGVKKPRKVERQSRASNGIGAPKVRKEKIGDRVLALQQLVSPFGKSDTASVLHEALGYIKFLHDQVQVLSSPYLQQLPPSARLHGTRIDLRSRGLCLVPISCTTQLPGSNGADLWSAVTKH